MARLNVGLRTPEPNRTARPARSLTPEQSESVLSGSDKENRGSVRPSRPAKRTSTDASMPDPSEPRIANHVKRRRTENEPQMNRSQIAHRRTLEDQENKQFYDPDQNADERRAVKKNIRNLLSKLNDSRAEYLQRGSKGLVETLKEADELYKHVKQTSDATIDSRLLVATADLSYRKVNNLTLGDSTVGVDVDDFITRCIRFMQQGSQNTGVGTEPRSSQSTQTQRRRRQQADEDAENGDACDWAYLGRNACFLSNRRPCLSGFLLGPLSVQKKVRQQTQRRQREALIGSQVVRPVALSDEDMERQESANLTVVCAEIAQLIGRTQATGEQNVTKEVDDMSTNPSEEEVYTIMRRHGITDNACVPLFDFCVNPKSFGQTIENLFYVSFLIKEGKVGLDFDSKGLPTLGLVKQRSLAERQEAQRNQAVFTLDFDTWEGIIESHGIENSIIPHRKDEVYDDGTIDFSRNDDSGGQDDAFI